LDDLTFSNKPIAKKASKLGILLWHCYHDWYNFIEESDANVGIVASPTSKKEEIKKDVESPRGDVFHSDISHAMAAISISQESASIGSILYLLNLYGDIILLGKKAAPLSIRSDPYDENTYNNIHSTVNMLMEDGIEDEVIIFNPSEGNSISKNRSMK
jgi:hypothetical protein